MSNLTPTTPWRWQPHAHCMDLVEDTTHQFPLGVRIGATAIRVWQTKGGAKRGTTPVYNSFTQADMRLMALIAAAPRMRLALAAIEDMSHLPWSKAENLHEALQKAIALARDATQGL